MKYQVIVLLGIVGLVSCKHSSSHREAIRLNDSAVGIAMQDFDQKQALRNAIALLNKATELDSNYLTGYSNKFIYQNQLGRYKDAIIAGEKIKKLAVIDGQMKVELGQTYERAGDTIMAKRYYSEGLNYFNKKLDTMKISNPSFNDLTHDKAMDLILLNNKKEALNLLKMLSSKVVDPLFRDIYLQEMNIVGTRNKLIKGNAIDTTLLNNYSKSDSATSKRIEMASRPSKTN
jgi:tetratricopeptide (TPR) repeat protein